MRRSWLPLSIVALAAVAMAVHGPIPQLAHYHEFADRRAFLGLANAGDVLSNVPFALVAVWGLAMLRGHAARERLGTALAGWMLFLLALLATAIGSSYYHLAPDDARLAWDRLPIALACAGLLAATYAQTHRRAPGLTLALGLAAFAVASVAWWSFTDLHGPGDLRPYLLLQGAPLVLIPLWQWIDGSPRAQRWALAAAIALYALAKAAELGDHAVYDALGFASGHTVKHLLAAAASAVLVAHMASSSRPSRAGALPACAARR